MIITKISLDGLHHSTTQIDASRMSYSYQFVCIRITPHQNIIQQKPEILEATIIKDLKTVE